MTFDGQDDFVEISTSTSLEDITDSSFTFEAWAKPQAGGGIHGIISRPGMHTGIRYNGDTQLFQSDFFTSSAQYTLGSSVSAPADNWYHLVLSIDDVAKEARLYVNGQVTAQPYIGTLHDYVNIPYYIGAGGPYTAGWAWYFKGNH